VTVRSGLIVGSYRLQRLLGRGGMGSVYLASRADAAYQKDVAIKLIAPGISDAGIIQRFHHERQTLAALEHPNIARLVDGGTTAEQQPYLVMEYVDGEPIDDYCDRRSLSTRERLTLFRQVCAAVQYAHQNLVVHRDLKPDNILVTSDGEPKLLDFGIAKLLQTDAAPEQTRLTQGSGPMTLSYASPEQVRGEPITTATDVYALGVLLYRLLSGRHPYERYRASMAMLGGAICQVDPEPASRAAAASGARDVARQLEGDLDTIVARAFDKEPTRRYQSAQQLSDDIQRHLEDRPVLARRDTVRYRANRFVRRHTFGTVAAALAVVLLVGGVMGIAWQARVAATQRDRAKVEARKAERVSALLQQAFGFADPSWFGAAQTRGKETKVLDVLDAAGDQLATDLKDEPEVRIMLERTIGVTYRSFAEFDKADAHLEAALTLSRQVYGPEHLETFASLYEYGSLQMFAGHYAAAAPLLRQAVDLRRRLSAPPDLTMLKALSDLAAVTVLTGGDTAKAEPLLNEALALARTLHNDSAMGVLLGNLGMVHEGRGDLAGAEPLLRESIAAYRRLPSPRYEEAIVMMNVGDVLRFTKQYSAALPMTEGAVRLMRARLGDEHPYVASALSHLSTLKSSTGDFAGAEAAAAEALRIMDRPGLREHPYYVGALAARGFARLKKGDARGAEPDLREVVSRAERLFPPGNRALAIVKGQLGSCLAAEGREEEARPLLEQSVRTLEATVGPTHPQTIEARERLAALGDARRTPVP
jgi:serine/threonine-protein kinase